MFRRWVISWNNQLVRMRRVRVAPENLLLLLPHCLQCSLCRQRVSHDLAECKRCGNCDMAGLLQLRDETRIQCRVAAGGREALATIRNPTVKAIVAVACEKELYEGICSAFPKPVLAITNSAPKGPCHDTRVEVERVRAAVQGMLAPGAA